jgi:hypothetical protein
MCEDMKMYEDMNIYRNIYIYNIYAYAYMHIQIGAIKASHTFFELSISALDKLTSESTAAKPQLTDDISCQVSLTKGLMLFGQDQVCLFF